MRKQSFCRNVVNNTECLMCASKEKKKTYTRKQSKHDYAVTFTFQCFAQSEYRTTSHKLCKFNIDA